MGEFSRSLVGREALFCLFRMLWGNKGSIPAYFYQCLTVLQLFGLWETFFPRVDQYTRSAPKIYVETKKIMSQTYRKQKVPFLLITMSFLGGEGGMPPIVDRKSEPTVSVILTPFPDTPAPQVIYAQANTFLFSSSVPIQQPLVHEQNRTVSVDWHHNHGCPS